MKTTGRQNTNYVQYWKTNDSVAVALM